MARFAVSCKFGATGAPIAWGSISEVMNASTTATNKTAVAADVATLVADGATPTQAHVNTLNTDWTALSADIAAGNLSAASVDAVLSFDAAVITTKTKLRRAVQALLAAVDAGVGGLAE